MFSIKVNIKRLLVYILCIEERKSRKRKHLARLIFLCGLYSEVEEQLAASEEKRYELCFLRIYIGFKHGATYINSKNYNDRYKCQSLLVL